MSIGGVTPSAVLGVGISLPGLVDRAAGMAVFAPNWAALLASSGNTEVKLDERRRYFAAVQHNTSSMFTGLSLVQRFTPAAGKEQCMFISIFGVATPKIEIKKKNTPCSPQAKKARVSESPGLFRIPIRTGRRARCT